MSIFDGKRLTEEEKIAHNNAVDAQAMAEMELAQRTRQSVYAMILDGAKFIACEVRNYSQGEEPHSNVVIVGFNEFDGYIDAQGNFWESAIALNYDGTGLKVYDYKKATRYCY